jgi:hypothetical protein
MESNLDLTRARWRKSSYSGSSGGECVEVADLVPHITAVAVRDSKDPSAGVIVVTPGAFGDFLRTLR